MARGLNRVVVAPDKFKGTLTAAQVAAHVAAGLERVRPGLQAIKVPVADGGDGTVDAAVAAGYRRVEAGVSGPTGSQLRSAGITRAYALADIEPDLARCLEHAGLLLEDLAERVAYDWLTP